MTETKLPNGLYHALKDHQYAKKKAIELFQARVIRARREGRINNTDLPAGSPMYFYCNYCGILCDKVEEEYIFSVYHECSQCRGMMKEGWLEEAKASI